MTVVWVRWRVKGHWLQGWCVCTHCFNEYTHSTWGSESGSMFTLCPFSVTLRFWECQTKALKCLSGYYKRRESFKHPSSHPRAFSSIWVIHTHVLILCHLWHLLSLENVYVQIWTVDKSTIRFKLHATMLDTNANVLFCIILFYAVDKRGIIRV